MLPHVYWLFCLHLHVIYEVGYVVFLFYYTFIMAVFITTDCLVFYEWIVGTLVFSGLGGMSRRTSLCGGRSENFPVGGLQSDACVCFHYLTHLMFDTLCLMVVGVVGDAVSISVCCFGLFFSSVGVEVILWEWL